MTEAFRCDCCRDFYSGEPAFEGSITGRTFHEVGYDHSIAQIGHKAGSDDWNPNKKPRKRVEWPLPIQGKSFEFCVACFEEYLLDGIQTAFLESEYND